MTDLTASPLAPATGLTARWLLPVWSLFAREILSFVRQRNRVLGALGTPVLFWFALGSGFGSSFRPPGLSVEMDYRAYFFPGAVMLVVLFTAIFAAISIIQDRNAGFLQGVQVAPVPRLAIVLGKVLGGAALGAGEGALMLLLAPLAGLSFGPLAWLGALGVLTLTAIALSALGFLFAWGMESVQGFHAVMNLLLFPLWLLSGSFFPASGAATWVQVVMAVNPLSYGLSALRHLLLGDAAITSGLGGAGLGASIAVLAAMAAALLLLCAWKAARPPRS